MLEVSNDECIQTNQSHFHLAYYLGVRSNQISKYRDAMVETPKNESPVVSAMKEIREGKAEININISDESNPSKIQNLLDEEAQQKSGDL